MNAHLICNTPLLAPLFGRIYLLSLTEVLGRGGTDHALKLADLRYLEPIYRNSTRFPRPEPPVPFPAIAQIAQAIRQMYGDQQGGVMLRTAGAFGLQLFRNHFLPLAHALDVLRAVPAPRLQGKILVHTIARTIDRCTSQATTITIQETTIQWSLPLCPCCWGHTHAAPICDWFVGLIARG